MYILENQYVYRGISFIFIFRLLLKVGFKLKEKNVLLVMLLFFNLLGGS